MESELGPESSIDRYFLHVAMAPKMHPTMSVGTSFGENVLRTTIGGLLAGLGGMSLCAGTLQLGDTVRPTYFSPLIQSLPYVMIGLGSIGILSGLASAGYGLAGFIHPSVEPVEGEGPYYLYSNVGPSYSITRIPRRRISPKEENQIEAIVSPFEFDEDTRKPYFIDGFIPRKTYADIFRGERLCRIDGDLSGLPLSLFAAINRKSDRIAGYIGQEIYILGFRNSAIADIGLSETLEN